LISFIVLPCTTCKILSGSGKNRYVCLVPNVRGKNVQCFIVKNNANFRLFVDACSD
jgi:hypothetical protein